MGAFDENLKVKYSKSLSEFDNLEQDYLDKRSELMSLLRTYDNHTQYKEDSALEIAKCKIGIVINELGDLQVQHMYNLLKLKRNHEGI